MLYIFVQDRGWEGSLSAVAETEEQAREFMKDEINYSPDIELEKIDIQPGLIHCNIGDR